MRRTLSLSLLRFVAVAALLAWVTMPIAGQNAPTTAEWRNIKNNPALKGLTIPRTGQRGVAGSLVTKTMVVAGEPQVTTTPEGRGAMLRAYDKATGKELGAVYMPSQQSGSPMTYMLNGKQYIVVAVGGPNFPGELIAYRLPN